MKYILTIVCFSISFLALSQKKEIRKANRMIEDKEYMEAREMLNSVDESQIEGKYASDYYKAMADTYLGDTQLQGKKYEDLIKAYEYYLKADPGDQRNVRLNETSRLLYNLAGQDGDDGNYEAGREKLLSMYTLQPKDTTALYFATSYAVNAGDYQTALDGYLKLQELGYTGQTTRYYGVDATGQKQYFPTKATRDKMVDLNQISKPGKETSESRLGEITKNVVLIYDQLGESEKALAALEQAKKENPDDKSLLSTEVTIYQRLGMKEEYDKAVEKIINSGSDDPIMYARMGEAALNNEEFDAAIPYLQKSLELDPNLYASYVNLAYTYIGKADSYVDQLNDLPSTTAGNKKYDDLVAKRKDLYLRSIGPLEKAMELRPDNQDTKDLLIDVYKRTGNTDKAKALENK